MAAKLKVTLVKSPISHTARTRATVRSLGLHRIGDSVEISDTPEMRGMANAVRFLLRSEGAEVAQPAAKAAPAAEAPAADGPPATQAPPAKPARGRKTKEEETK